MSTKEIIWKRKLLFWHLIHLKTAKMDTIILEKYQSLPNDLQKEVVDFIEFLENKYQKQPIEQVSLAQKRASLFGNAKGLITILPGFDDIPEGFEEYQ